MSFEIPDVGLTPVAIGTVQFDALLEITEKYDANVPMNTTDRGYETTDDIIPNLMKVDMKLFVTPTPVTWSHLPSHVGRNPRDVVDGLVALMNTRKPVFVTTYKKNYNNMMIQKLSVEKNADIGYALEIDVSLIQLAFAPYGDFVLPDDYEVSDRHNVAQVLEVGAIDGYMDVSNFGMPANGGR